jgi:digeranylgeranylglycerophospholipid reductase
LKRESTHDIVIVGGGPGGFYAARCLAEQGFQVTLVEEHIRPGQPVHCTGILSRAAFDEFALPHNAILNPLIRARFISPARHCIEYSTERVEAVVVDRHRFDQELWKRAESAGVRILLGTRATAVVPRSRDVEIGLGGCASIRGRACILARDTVCSAT